MMKIQDNAAPWARDKILDRLDQQVERFRSAGMRVSRKSLLEAGGLDESVIRKLAAHDPQLSTLTALAEAFGLTLGQLLGIEPQEAEPICDPNIMRAAVGLVAALIPTPPGSPLVDRQTEIADLAALAYEMLAAGVRADPEALNSPSNRAIILSQLRAAIKSTEAASELSLEAERAKRRA